MNPHSSLPDVFELKRQARALRATLANAGTSISHMQALHRIAGQYHYRSWELLEATLRHQAPTEADDSMPLQVKMPNDCRSPLTDGEPIPVLGANSNLTAEALRQALARIGPPDEERVYAYVASTVHLRDGQFYQTGSAPNFHGGVVSVCTCKHLMRATLTPEQWKGAWLAIFTSWTPEFSKQQYLVCLMRVGQAYRSFADLVESFQASGRAAALAAKDSRYQPLGDLMMPAAPSLPLQERFLASSYRPPMVGHSHRKHATDETWKRDIEYQSATGKHPPLLVGQEDFTFNWTHPMVFRAKPELMRGHRRWTLSGLLEELNPLLVA